MIQTTLSCRPRSQKVQLDRRTRRIKETEEEEEEKERRRKKTKMRVWHHLRTAGSAIIPRPFEFSSFVITTNTRQMKRAKSERKGERKKNGGEER